MSFYDIQEAHYNFLVKNITSLSNAGLDFALNTLQNVGTFEDYPHLNKGIEYCTKFFEFLTSSAVQEAGHNITEVGVSIISAFTAECEVLARGFHDMVNSDEDSANIDSQAPLVGICLDDTSLFQ